MNRRDALKAIIAAPVVGLVGMGEPTPKKWAGKISDARSCYRVLTQEECEAIYREGAVQSAKIDLGNHGWDHVTKWYTPDGLCETWINGVKQ